MSLTAALFAASFALKAVGMYNQYQTAKDTADLQEAQIDIKRQEQELQEKIRIRKESAKERAQRAKIVVRDRALNAAASSIFSNKLEASQSALAGDIHNIREYGNLQQEGFDIQESMVEAKEPSQLDLALNIGSAAVNSYSGYKSSQAGLAEPTTTRPGGAFAFENSTYSSSNSPFGR